MVRKSKKSIEATEATVTEKINNFIGSTLRGSNDNDNMSDDEVNIYIESLRNGRRPVEQPTAGGNKTDGTSREEPLVIQDPDGTSRVVAPPKPKLKRVKKVAVELPSSTFDYKLEYEKLKGLMSTSEVIQTAHPVNTAPSDRVGWNKNTKLF